MVFNRNEETPTKLVRLLLLCILRYTDPFYKKAMLPVKKQVACFVKERKPEMVVGKVSEA
jgi:hypothetical protein